ncbi:MAG: porin [Alphaproteobacteria bacterium]|nr:porin [Alphaproteobacteria bacterium]
MKKILIGTTALIAVGMLATAANATPRVQLGGFMNFYGGWSNDYEVPGVRTINAVDFINEAEAHVRISTDLGNGMRTGGTIQFRGGVGDGDNNGQNIVKRVWGWVESNRYGRTEIGTRESAPYQMQVSAPDVGVFGVDGTDLVYIIPSLGDNAYGVIGSTQLDRTYRNMKITYFTPQVHGLQAGFSFTPRSGNESGATGFDKTFGYNPLAVDGNAYEGAVSYTVRTGAVKGRVVAGVGFYERIPTTAGTFGGTTWAARNSTEYSLGTQLGFGAITLGAGFRYVDLNEKSDNPYSWNLGAAYQMGRNEFSLSVANWTAVVDNGIEDVRSSDYMVLASAKHTLAEGVDAFVSGGYVYYDKGAGSLARRHVGMAVGGMMISF